MARNAELIRQWEILREVDGARVGIAVAKLAAAHHVHKRTISRDLEALSQAGFPLYTEKVNGTTMWKLNGKPFKGLEETGLSVMELCALYFTRSLLETFAGRPFRDELDRAFLKIERALPPAARTFLDALPRLMKAKMTGRKKIDEKKTHDIISRAADASLRHRRVTMRYASASSRRTKEYVVEPQRITCAEGGIYLTAWVPDYGQLRTFAAERIETLSVLDERFEPRPLPSEPFGDSIGVNTGPRERVDVQFDAEAAPYIREREWHRSQQIQERQDGSVLVTLEVCNDYALRRWILGFGSRARVISPATLAQQICDEFELARRRYVASFAQRHSRLPVRAQGRRAS